MVACAMRADGARLRGGGEDIATSRSNAAHSASSIDSCAARDFFVPDWSLSP